jgi:hypothetical protein
VCRWSLPLRTSMRVSRGLLRWVLQRSGPERERERTAASTRAGDAGGLWRSKDAGSNFIELTPKLNGELLLEWWQAGWWLLTWCPGHPPAAATVRAHK